MWRRRRGVKRCVLMANMPHGCILRCPFSFIFTHVLDFGVPMPDIYTKVILTVIAAALSIIALQGSLTSRAGAENAFCGSEALNPCYIKADGALTIEMTTPGDLPVSISNWPKRLDD
jgi:hypothetical protein